MDIEARLETLETKLRLHKRLGLAAACLIAVATVIGATRPIPKVIEAEKFVVKNPSGEQVALLGWSKEGPSLLMTHGKMRLTLNASNKVTGMGITKTPSDEPVVAFGVAKDAPTLVMSHGKEKLAMNVSDKPALLMTHGKETLLLTVSDEMTGMSIGGTGREMGRFFSGLLDEKGEKKKSIIVLNDSKGKNRLFLMVSEKEESETISAMSIFDSAGKERITLRVSERDGKKSFPEFSLSDSSEKMRAIIGIIDDEDLGLLFIDRKGRVRATLGLTEGKKPMLRFLDEKGNPYWEAPPEKK